RPVEKLGEILVRARRLTEARLREALESQPEGVRLGEHLISLGAITEEHLYQALSLQGSVPFSRLEPRRVRRRIARALPAHVVRQLRIVPFQVSRGFLFLAGPDLPGDRLNEIARFTRLAPRFQLVTRSNFEQLEAELL